MYGTQPTLKYPSHWFLEKNWPVILFIALQIFLLIGLFVDPLFSILLFFGLAILALTSFSVEKSILLLVFYIICLPVKAYQHSSMPFVLNSYVVLVIIFGIITYWMCEFVMKKRPLVVKLQGLDYPIIFLLFIAGFSTFLGFVYNNPLRLILLELKVFLFFSLYFVSRSYVKSVKDVRKMLYTIIIAAVIVSFEYIYFFINNIVSGIGVVRFVTRQANMFLVAITFSVALFPWLSKPKKILMGILLIPLTFATLISQTRGLWITLIISLLVVVGYALKNPSMARKKVIALIALALFTLVGISLFFFQKTGGDRATAVIGQRAATLKAVDEDVAVLHRVVANMALFQKIKAKPILGEGLGSSFRYWILGDLYQFNWTDSTYTVIWWKLGLGGLMVYLWLLVRTFKRNVYIYKNTTDEFSRLYSIAMISLFSALVVWGLTSAVLVKYRFNLIWAILIGITEALARKTEVEKIEEDMLETR